MPRKGRRKGRRGYHHGDLRNALVGAGLQLVVEEGLQALSLRAVARAAGVSHMAPYNHFPDRASLVAAVAAEAYDRLTSALLEAMASLRGQPARQLQEAGIAYVRFAVENPELFRLMFSPELADTSAHPVLAEASARTLSVLAGAMQRSASAGPRTASTGPVTEASAPVTGEARVVPLIAWSMVHGLAVLLLDGQFGEPATAEAAERYARLATDLMWTGLRSGLGG